jgi:hypothetical protein
MENIFFFQTQQITDDTILFDEFKQQNILYSYFQVDQNYYLFVYAQKSIDINFLYQSGEIIQELDSKQRKIRSLRGFFLYALEIMEKGKDYEILETNLQPFFWRKVKNIIRQNKKAALQEFLFGKYADSKPDNQASNPRIQILEDQVNSLQEKVIQLEAKLMRVEQNSKYPLSEPSHPLESSKTIQPGNSNLNTNSGSYFQKNNQGDKLDSNMLSEASKMPSDESFQSQQYNIPSGQEKAQNRLNFITLSKISEQEKIEIIQTGFQLNQQGKISLKKYYESTEEYSLFQWKGYSIKYESIRRTKLYQNLKE